MPKENIKFTHLFTQIEFDNASLIPNGEMGLRESLVEINPVDWDLALINTGRRTSSLIHDPALPPRLTFPIKVETFCRS